MTIKKVLALKRSVASIISNHTIISRELIKPSSPTPRHLKTYNLSLFDQISLNTFMPIVLFYQNTTAHSSHDKTIDLKKSLSKTLKMYYPFAGRHAKIAPNHVDCNDHGAEFLEATTDSALTDGGSFAHFLYDWGKMTKHDEFSIDPKFLYVPNINLNFDGLKLPTSKDTITGSFIFPNSKIKDLLQLKVQSMTAESGQPITNPTRVEVLCWLLYKSAVAAATTNNNSRFSIPTGINHTVNIRDEMTEALPNNSIGNRYMIMKMLTNNQSEMKPEAFINDFKKQKMEFCNLQNIETALGSLSTTSESDLKEMQGIIDAAYICSSISRYPLYDVDFGWGKPLKVTVAGSMMKNCFVMIATPDQDGIEVLVSLEKKEMAIIQTDPELLAYCR
nr:acylsugar acyltransferase 3-like [Tanacetum cinerariifolium]